jgi:hypothetical protein
LVVSTEVTTKKGAGWSWKKLGEMVPEVTGEKISKKLVAERKALFPFGPKLGRAPGRLGSCLVEGSG